MSSGVSAKRTEIIPDEPDPGNAGVGRKRFHSGSHPLFYSFKNSPE